MSSGVGSASFHDDFDGVNQKRQNNDDIDNYENLEQWAFISEHVAAPT